MIMDKVTALLGKMMFILERILAVAFLAAVALNFINVVGRYVFSWSLIWSDEVQVFIMIWMTFLGAAIVTWRQAHLRMDVLFEALPIPAKAAIKLAEAVIALIICGFVTYQGYAYARRMFMLGRESDMAHIPMWIPHSAVAVGFGLITLVLVVIALGKLATWRQRPAPSPSSESIGHVEVRS